MNCDSPAISVPLPASPRFVVGGHYRSGIEALRVMLRIPLKGFLDTLIKRHTRKDYKSHATTR